MIRLTSLCKRWMALRIQWPDACERLGLLFLPTPGLGSGFFDGELTWQFLALGAETKTIGAFLSYDCAWHRLSFLSSSVKMGWELQDNPWSHVVSRNIIETQR